MHLKQSIFKNGSVLAALPFLFLANTLVSAAGQCNELVESSRKPRPGHYVALGRRDTREDLVASLTTGVVGAQIRYSWKDLEPEQGVYDLSSIRDDLALVAKSNSQLVVMVEDKSFNEAALTPDYLQSLTLANRQNGFTAARWNPLVVERMNALTHAIGKEFDCHPNFEGLSIQESALGIDDKVLAVNGYSPEKYRDALESILLSAAASMPNSQVFWYMNFFPGNQNLIDDLAAKLIKPGVAMGGPDILPDNAALAARTYKFYDQFNGRIPLFGSMQNDSYAHLRKNPGAAGKYWTLRELFEFARDELHVSYIFWNRKMWRKPPDSYDWSDAAALIAEEKSFSR